MSTLCSCPSSKLQSYHFGHACLQPDPEDQQGAPFEPGWTTEGDAGIANILKKFKWDGTKDHLRQLVDAEEAVHDSLPLAVQASCQSINQFHFPRMPSVFQDCSDFISRLAVQASCALSYPLPAAVAMTGQVILQRYGYLQHPPTHGVISTLR